MNLIPRRKKFPSTFVMLGFLPSLAYSYVFLPGSSTLDHESSASNDYVILVPSNLPPPISPLKITTVSTKQVVHSLLTDLGPVFNEKVTESMFQKAFQKALVDGLAQAKRLGQRGVLLKPKLVVEPTPAAGIKFYSLEGSGVEVIGIGPSAQDVCLANKCNVSLSPRLGPTQQYAMNYTFASEDSKGEVKLETFNNRDLESRTALILASPTIAEAALTGVRVSMWSGYSLALRDQITTRQEKIEIDQLIQSRMDAIRNLEAIDKDLSAELERAARIARTSSTLDNIAGLFTLANAAYLAANAAGDSQSKARFADAKSVDEVKLILKDIEAESGRTVNDLRIRRNTYTNTITGAQKRILEIGVELGSPAPSLLKN